ncbi:MAG: HIT domain-containing protein [Bacilli bacterium]|nr:HIT domain-containing protein [Bacilli bacterium]
MNCLFCKIANKDINSMQLYEDDFIIAFLDINPQCEGHTLIIPKEHFEDYTEVPSDIMNHIFKKAEVLGKALTKKLKSKGYRLIINYGDEQEVKHFHLHILPNLKNKGAKDVKEVFEKLTKKKS